MVNKFNRVTFLNISALDTNHNSIVAFHKQLETFCNETYTWDQQSTAVFSSCKWMKFSTKSIFHQNKQVKGEILGSILTQITNQQG